MTGLDLTTDVLVVGGGPAATWAALKAAQAGAQVVLADKGHCGTSGATASAGTGVWYVPPDPAAREAAMASREKLGGHLHADDVQAVILGAGVAAAVAVETGAGCVGARGQRPAEDVLLVGIHRAASRVNMTRR